MTEEWDWICVNFIKKYIRQIKRFWIPLTIIVMAMFTIGSFVRYELFIILILFFFGFILIFMLWIVANGYFIDKVIQDVSLEEVSTLVEHQLKASKIKYTRKTSSRLTTFKFNNKLILSIEQNGNRIYRVSIKGIKTYNANSAIILRDLINNAISHFPAAPGR